MRGDATATLTAPHVLELADLPRTGAGLIDLDVVAAALAPCDLLESAPGQGWSYAIPHGGPVLVDDGRTSRLVPGQPHPGLSDEASTDDPPLGRAALELGGDPFAAIDAVADRYGIDPDGPRDAALPPFHGGLVGAFAYDLARRIERLPGTARADRDQLHLQLRVADVVVAVGPDRRHAVVVTHAGIRTRRPAELARRIATRLAAARSTSRLLTAPRAAMPTPHATPHRTPQQAMPTPHPTPQQVTTSLPRDRYLEAVRAALASIAAGDAFQVNLTQRLTARWDGDVAALYRAMRSASPAPFGAMLPTIGVASISPESFLAVDGRTVTTRPIKGTRPRAAEPALDAAFADDLAIADKDRAENVMIVDLERNDLGRVCEPGSVRVPRLVELEEHPTVWHLVSTVSGQLCSDVGFGELLRATFPCGSITGAPKVSAMSIIERLEPVRRGWYCGAIGAIGPGVARLSVAIRTATLHPDGRVDHGAGGGIVADSDPEGELAESLDKAAAFLRAVAATHVTTGAVHAAASDGAPSDGAPSDGTASHGAASDGTAGGAATTSSVVR